MIDHDARKALIGAAAGASRARRPGGGIAPHPAWADLDAAGREEAYRAALAWRRAEAALDRDGLSSTARSILSRIVPLPR
jgi:hypothetical protein